MTASTAMPGLLHGAHRVESPSAEHWGQIEKLFHAAISLDGRSRQGYLEYACRGDVALRRQVESLIFSLEEPASTGVLTRAVGRAAGNLLNLPPGQRTGAYEILR